MINPLAPSGGRPEAWMLAYVRVDNQPASVRVLEFAAVPKRQLPLAPEQVARALTYFVDAEKEPMPRGCRVPSEKVKKDIANGVREWDRERTRGLVL